MVLRGFIEEMFSGLKISCFSLCAFTLFFFMGCEKKDNAKPPKLILSVHEESDEKAVQLADALIEACGGMENWNNTRFLVWRFLGKRYNVWDRWTGNYRSGSRTTITLLNLNDKTGEAWMHGRKITDADELKRVIDYSYNGWINDSYWMFLPFKLKDDGVILNYLGQEKTIVGDMAEVVRVTFDNVGLTPDNMYHLYLDPETHLIKEWDYYVSTADSAPQFRMEWNNFQKYGELLLSDERGRKKHTHIAALDKLPSDIFTKPERPDWKQFIPGLSEQKTVKGDPGSEEEN